MLTGEAYRLEATQALLPFKPKRIFLEKPLVARGGQAHVVQADFWDGKTLLQQAQEAGADDYGVFLIDLANCVDDLLLNVVPYLVRNAVRLIENFVVNKVRAFLVVLGHLSPDGDQNIDNVRFGIFGRVE